MVERKFIRAALVAAVAGWAMMAMPGAVYAAVGCRLNNPDQDVKRLHPESTNYRTHFVRIDERGGDKLYRELEKRLGDKWDPNWETADIPYSFYEVLKGPERIGWVFGANQGYPGADNAQIIVATDLQGRISELFLQKLPSLEKSRFQSREFYGQFVGLTLEQFYLHEALSKADEKSRLKIYDMVGRIKDPSQKEPEGFKKLLRGVKKILVNFDEFWLANRTGKDSVLRKAEYLVKNADKVPTVEEPLAAGTKFFKDASRVVAELPAPADKGKEFVAGFWKRIGGTPDKGEENGELPLPTLLVYKADNYSGEFVRGRLLGYVVLVPPEGGGKEPAVVLAADTRGKIVGVAGGTQAETDAGNRLRDFSLTNFYVHDAFREMKAQGGKLDKLAEALEAMPASEKGLPALLRRVKKALVMLDEFYLGNYYKRDKVFELVRKYLEKQEDGK